MVLHRFTVMPAVSNLSFHRKVTAFQTCVCASILVCVSLDDEDGYTLN